MNTQIARPNLIDFNRTAENLGLTSRDITPVGWWK